MRLYVSLILFVETPVSTVYSRVLRRGMRIVPPFSFGEGARSRRTLLNKTPERSIRHKVMRWGKRDKYSGHFWTLPTGIRIPSNVKDSIEH
jgi:hypothetical protein